MRTSILNMLRNYPNEYLSGEEISRQLAVSRTAIWKHIQTLKQGGYEIEAHPRRGYRLKSVPDFLLPDEIRDQLQTKTLGQQEIFYFEKIESTNNEAKKQANLGCHEGAIVLAEMQNGGRGRISRSWFSPAGKGIWLSVVLKPPFHPYDAPKCTLLAAVAVTKAIRSITQVQCGIKWPNDILYEGKKIVGILTEMNAEMDAINHVVIGMGINVNISQEEFPLDIRETATSLSAAAHKPIPRLPLLQEILSALEKEYHKVIQYGFVEMLDEWRELSVTLGQTVDIIGVSQKSSGLAVDIDKDGALLVEIEGRIEKIIAGDVSIRPHHKENLL
ncbi:biotin--[acetyl-CoA-carboxylase] ligase [Pelosinus propionicus]|uniref:Bifunctional ligase/repressor BirA n=1 Tax=Pelosinus propionicus DSM 13327 TaxID=1123291 RepID=A0A1I4NS57_9FIRM|nr:biotin--[acetyl-CoA-carboxylase] ligase [Pelosinus propionicus]SFM18341.1 BirA family transcriptional regulator, biotin operon repressor / biotin-[acetyl-CoA-carboxylase] ligase [Pelosinus propionicus DSM 13327]